MEKRSAEKLTGWDWTEPRGFLLWCLITMLFVGVASLLFINIGVPWGVTIPDDARAGYWATAIGSGVALAGSMVAIVLARRAHEVSQNLYQLEQRVEQRQVDNEIRHDVLEAVAAIRGLGDALVAHVASAAPMRDSAAKHMLRVALAGQSFTGPRDPLWRLCHGFKPDAVDNEAFLHGCRQLEIAIDRTLASPMALAAMTARLASIAEQDGIDNLEAEAVPNLLSTVRSALVNNLRRLPVDVRLSLAGLFSEGIGKHWDPASDPDGSELRGQALSAGFCGTLMAREAQHTAQGQSIVSAGCFYFWNLLQSVPARSDLVETISAHYAPILHDAMAEVAIRDSVERVLDSVSVIRTNDGGQILSLSARRLSLSIDLLRRKIPGLRMEVAYTDLQPETAFRLKQELDAQWQSAMAAHTYSATTRDCDATVDALLLLYQCQAVRLTLVDQKERDLALLDLGKDVFSLVSSMGRRAEIEAEVFRTMAKTAIAASFSVLGDDAASEAGGEWSDNLPPEYGFYAALCGTLACLAIGDMSERFAELTFRELESLYLQFATQVPPSAVDLEAGAKPVNESERIDLARFLLEQVRERLMNSVDEEAKD